MRLGQTMGSSIIQTFKRTNFIYNQSLAFMPMPGQHGLGIKKSQAQGGRDSMKEGMLGHLF